MKKKKKKNLAGKEGTSYTKPAFTIVNDTIGI